MQRKSKRALLIIGIFVVAIGGAAGLSNLKPPPETNEVADVVPLVDVLALEPEDIRFTIASQGTVRPRTETVLSAEISGAIVSISPKFIAGGLFRRGEELLRIDPTNYEVAVKRADAMLKQRQIEFDGAEKLRSQGYRAESEFASAAAALAAADADLVNARRNLERTRIRLPYDGMVRAKEADLGQYVNPGTRLGVTFATDFAEVRLPLTDADLGFVDLPSAAEASDDSGAPGPMVALSATQKGRPQTWTAQIVRTEGVVDEKNRVTYVVARIEDPYRLEPESSGAPLPMGSFVVAAIEGTTLQDIIRVPRSALRNNRQLMFVDEENRLRMGDVDVIRSDAEYAYLRNDNLQAGRISVTVLESPISGMRVRTNDDVPDDDSARLAKGDVR